MFDESRPIFVQIAERISGDILDGALVEECQVPSTNEMAAFYRINPATVAKGVGELVADGVLYKKRGIGMFVSCGARSKLLAQRRDLFAGQYIVPLVHEAAKLGISTEELQQMIAEGNIS